MALIATISTAAVRDLGFVSPSQFQELERSFEDSAGNGQFVALIEGITHDEASADDSPWFTNLEKPGRVITIVADTYEDLSEAVAWVSENYDVFSTHVETDEPQPPTYRVQEGYDGWSYLEVVRSDDETMARWSLAEGAFDRATAERLATGAVFILTGGATDAFGEVEQAYDVEVAAQVRAAVGSAQDAAVNRFPNDAGAALRYLSALLAVAAEEV